MFLLLFLLLLLTLPAIGSELKFNFQPAKNNLEIFPTEDLKQILPNIRGVKDFSCGGNRCRVTLYPLLVSYSLEGFSPFTRPKLERYLGLKTFYRYPEESLSSAANNIVFFLRNNGYLDITVKGVLKVDRRGYAKLRIIGSEGELYLWGGFLFNGTLCFSPSHFYRSYGKPFGIPFSYIELYTAVDLAQELCRKKGYYESFVYYSEPFEVKKETLFHFLWKNFRNNPLSVLDFLSHYLDTFIDNPLKGISLLFEPLSAVYPQIEILTVERPLDITFEGNRYFSDRRLEGLLKDILRSRGFVSPLVLQNALLELYRSAGFFDAHIEIHLTDRHILVKIEEGTRYGLEVKFIPPLKGFEVEIPPHYSRKFETKLLEEVKKFLRSQKLVYKAVKIHREIDRKRKVVVLTVFVEGLREVDISTRWELLISNRSLRELVEDILEGEDPYLLVMDGERVASLRKRIISLLRRFGCSKPEVLVKVEDFKTRIAVLERVSCGGILKFHHTAYWVEGRIRKRELDYLMPDFYGKRFNRKLVDILRNRLSRSNLFESYGVEIVRNGKAIPLVEAVEKKPLTLEGQLGFSSDEGYLADLSFKLNDPFGFGSRFALQYRLSSKRTLYRLSYLDDYFFSKRLFTGGELFKKYEEHRDFTISSKGYSLTLGYHLNLYTDLALTFISSRFGLDSPYTHLREGNLHKFTLSGEIYYPLYRGLVKRGIFDAFINLSVATHRGNYSKFRIGNNLSLFFGDIYGSFRLSAGYVSPKAPIFEKFYLGGLKDLKGYSYESVAPAGGGDIFWYFGTEWGFPLFKPAYLFGGLDFGNAVKKSENPFGEIKKDAFIGVGSVTAAGPIRFVIAVPLENRIKVQDIKYLFLVGFNF